jgi:NADH:ubiquinone oxidoreductase subunit 5 (subunit L)/multisubunit Na+/H+ antiporter MnhA subunit
MTIKTFWIVLLKIIGLSLLFSCVSIIPHFLSMLPSLRNSSDNLSLLLPQVILLLVALSLYIFFIRLFLFKPSWIMEKLKLDKGFEEDKIDLNWQPLKILNIAIIVIGGLIFIDAAPEICRQLFVYFQQKNLFSDSPTSNWIIFNFSKAIIGCLLIAYNKDVVAFVERRTKISDSVDE